MKKEGFKIRINSVLANILIVFGISIAGLFGLTAISEIGNNGYKYDTETFIVIVIIMLMGIILIIVGINIKNKIKRVRNYISIASCGTKTFEEFASITGKNVEYIEKDLKKLVSKNYFGNTHVDNKRGMIIINDLNITEPITKDDQIMHTAYCSKCGTKVVKSKLITVHCSHCGAAVK